MYELFFDFWQNVVFAGATDVWFLENSAKILGLFSTLSVVLTFVLSAILAFWAVYFIVSIIKPGRY